MWIVVALFYIVPPLMFLMSLLAIFWPRAAWYMHEGWKFRGAEPSTMALVMTRIGGFLGCLFSVFFLGVVMTIMPIKFGPAVPPAAPAPVQAIPKN